MARRLNGDLLTRVPPVGEITRRASGGPASPDEGLLLLQRDDVRVEAEATFTADHERLGLTLSETRIDTVYSGTLMHLDAVNPATQAAFPDLRPDQLLIKVNGDLILGLDYETVMNILATTRPITLTFASSPHMEGGNAGAGLVAPPGPGEEYTVRIPSGGSFGFNLRDDGHGDVVIDSFSNEKPGTAGVVPGSLLLWVHGIGVRGQGHAGVQRAIVQCADAQAVEFVLQAPGVGPDSDELMPFIPFDCVFEDPGKLGLTFEQLPIGDDGTPAPLVISRIERGTQADRYTYLRPGMQVTAVNGQSIVGLSLDAARNRCTTRPLTLTLIDPQLGAAAGMEHVFSPLLGAHADGDEHDDAPATPNILDRVDALLAVGPAEGGTEDEVGLYGMAARSRNGGVVKPSTGPLRERRRWRQGDELESQRPPRPSPSESGASFHSADVDDHDEILRRIDELYSRQANRMRPAREPVTTEDIDGADDLQHSAINPSAMRTAGWGTRIASIAAASAATVPSWKQEPASHGVDPSAPVPRDRPAPAWHPTPAFQTAYDDPLEDIGARRRAREARRQSRNGSSMGRN